MAKTITVTYSASWSTDFEVPDDFVVTEDTVQTVARANANDFDFQDGSADWELATATVEKDGQFVDEFYF